MSICICSRIQQSFYVTAELVIQQSYYVTDFVQSLWCSVKTFTEVTNPRLQEHDWSRTNMKQKKVKNPSSLCLICETNLRSYLCDFEEL